jgi:hypothetical protein
MNIEGNKESLGCQISKDTLPRLKGSLRFPAIFPDEHPIE